LTFFVLGNKRRRRERREPSPARRPSSPAGHLGPSARPSQPLLLTLDGRESPARRELLVGAFCAGYLKWRL